MKLKILLIFNLHILIAVALESVKNNNTNNINNSSARAFSRDCLKAYSTTCFKLDIVSFVERLSENDNYSLLPGVNVIREKSISDMKTSDLVAELAREFPNDAEARLNAFLLKKVENYLNTHSLRFKLLDKRSVDAARDFVDATARGKKGKGMTQAIIAGLMMIKGTLLPIAMGALAMMAGKALMTGLLSLMLSTIIGLRSLTRGNANLTYEIVSKPVYTQAHTHSTAHEDHAGYTYGHSRSFRKDLKSSKEQLPVQDIRFVYPTAVTFNKIN